MIALKHTPSITANAIREAKAALSRPIAEAEGLPGAFYGNEFYELEQKTLFPRSWCAVAVGASLPEPGHAIPVNLAGWPILIVRGRDGVIRAFHNICRHRAMQLVKEPCKGALIRCPWHSWSYDLEGKLMATPEIGGAKIGVAEGFDKASLGLKEIRTGQWLDYIFVNIDGKAPAFEEYIKPLKDLLSSYNLESLRHGISLEDIYNGNWKLATEGGIEDYHLPFGHPQLNAHLYRNTKPYSAAPTFSGGGIKVETQATDERPWNARLPNLTLTDGREIPELFVFNVFPTGTVLISADHLMIGVLLPDGPAKTKVELHLYFSPEAAAAPDFEAARQGILDMWLQVLPQDFPFVEGTQATVMARDAAGVRTRFSPYWEDAVFNFQKMVLEAVT